MACRVLCRMLRLRTTTAPFKDLMDSRN